MNLFVLLKIPFKEMVRVQISCKTIFLSLMVFLFSTMVEAHRINAYKFIHIDETGNMYGVENKLTEYFSKIGFQTVDSYEAGRMSKENKNLLLNAYYEWNIVYGGHSTLVLTLSDITGTTILKVSGRGKTFSAKGDMKLALKGIFRQIDGLYYTFNPNLNPNMIIPKAQDIPSFSSLTGNNNNVLYPPFQNLQDAQKYFQENILDKDEIEGIYDVDYVFDAYAINRGKHDEGHAVCVIYKIEEQQYKYAIQQIEGSLGITSIERLGESDNYILLHRTNGGTMRMRFRLDDIFYFEAKENISQPLPGGTGTAKITFSFLKRFPTRSQYQTAIKRTEDNIAQENEPSQWSGTGFALNEGYIVTNNHVVEGATSIKIYGVRGDMERCYRATVVGTDKINDLALLKMESYISTNTDVLPYSVKFSMAEVGEDIFVLGYPLTQLLGNEIKLTNGIISSRTGYDGDVNNYQISAPVQPGNSGGPVFDKDGNVVGIVVSGMDKKLATNVNYAIKTSCLANLVESVADKTIFPTGRNLRGLSLAEQTKKVKDFIYYIHCSSE